MSKTNIFLGILIFEKDTTEVSNPQKEKGNFHVRKSTFDMAWGSVSTEINFFTQPNVLCLL